MENTFVHQKRTIMAKGLTAVEKSIFKCIGDNRNFVLDGGAGSGKTETLKRVLTHISDIYPDKKIVCITHTNLAVDEIKSRVGGDYLISTIHSFLYSLIKDYKKNTHQIIHNIYQISHVQALSREDFDNEKVYRTERHDKYKKVHKKFSKLRYKLRKELTGKVIGKKEYEKDSDRYDVELNIGVKELNDYIKVLVESLDYKLIK